MSAVVLVLATALPAGATTYALPKPATASALASEVRASTSITAIPTAMDPPLASVANDRATYTTYHARESGCRTISASCTWGDTKSHKIAVLFGDSHAWMWLPAVVPPLAKAGFKVQLVWMISCPAAEVDVNVTADGIRCSTWRTSMLATIKGEKPALVMFAERTTDVDLANGDLVTPAEWTTGLEASINAVKGRTTKVVVIGDNPAYVLAASPVPCLAAHPTAVQECATSTTGADATWTDDEPAEKAAATATGATFVDPTPWLCPGTRCSPIIGKYAVYFDWSHITATYAAYLSGVMGTKLKPAI